MSHYCIQHLSMVTFHMAVNTFAKSQKRQKVRQNLNLLYPRYPYLIKLAKRIRAQIYNDNKKYICIVYLTINKTFNFFRSRLLVRWCSRNFNHGFHRWRLFIRVFFLLPSTRFYRWNTGGLFSRRFTRNILYH